ncbi:MAG TPA: FAD-binding oxidoreductase [Ignavibacteria bacterium]|nr:FAD-binding oxidoreductase [Ignavibacteria bacterium]
MNLTSGYPYWLINSGLPNKFEKLSQDVKTDVVILGGGISGALTSYYLINSGIDCILVDARTIGLGSTCASTSLLQYELDTPLCKLSKQIGFKKAARSYKLCSESIDTLNDISNKLKFKEFEKNNSLFYAAYKKHDELIHEEYLIRKKCGFQVEHLIENDIEKGYGFSASSAILSEQGGTTDAYLFTHALLKESEKKGLRIYDRTNITEIEYKKRSVKLRTENNCNITAKKIVNATGFEITEFINKKIVKLISTYALISENIKTPSPVWNDKILIWNTDDPYLYLRLTKDNRVIIGGRDEDFSNAVKRDKLIKKKSTQLVKDFEKLFPEIELLPEFRWTGTFGTTKDSLPYIGTYEKTPHTYYALGFGGNGITFSVIAAEIICDLIKGKRNANAELFSFQR